VKKLHNRRGGFTLIELMIVVAIIGILAAIAIPNFLRFQLKAKSSEGKTNLAAIRTAEESYFAEYGLYISANPSPAVTALNEKTTWTNADAGYGFETIGWDPEGRVYFNYSVQTNATNSQFYAAAGADIDADTVGQMWGYKKAGTDDFASKDNGWGACPAGWTVDTVVACDPTFGNSVF
jgi:type IV pilus assembly protein PilA